MSIGPVVLGPNQPDRPYRGGAGIAAFRGTPQPSEFSPEDFVGSTTEIFTGGGVGLSSLPSGELVRDAVAADPVGYLGPDHVRRYGASSELLVKLLDTGERLFVHLHPDGPFAAEHLALPHGKTEAWIVTAVAGHDASASLGFTRDVSADEVEAWVDEQDAAAMLRAMHRVPLAAGSTLLVPAGMPHAIGAGVTLVELQEPSDLSILLEYSGYRDLGAADAFLGLPREVALAALDRREVTEERIAELTSGRSEQGGTGLLFPAEADAFFRAERVQAPAELDPGFAVLVVLEGSGSLSWAEGELPVAAGQTLLLPFGAGAVSLTGIVTAVRCRPPAP